MLRNLEATRYYNGAIKRDSSVDNRIRNVVNINPQQKRLKILDFFTKVPSHKISEMAMRTLNKILDDSLHAHTQFKNHDKANGLYANDLLYVFCTSSPTSRQIASLQLYLEDTSRHSQHNVNIVYNLLKECGGGESEDTILEFVSDSEEEIDLENDDENDEEIIEVTL